MKRILATVLVFSLAIVNSGRRLAHAEESVNDAGGGEPSAAPEVSGVTTTPRADQAFVDIEKLIAGCRKYERRKEAIRERMFAFSRTMKTLMAEQKRLQSDLANASSESKPGLKRELRKVDAQLADDLPATAKEIAVDSRQLYDEMCDEILAEVRRYARDKGLLLVCRKSELPPPRKAGEPLDYGVVLKRVQHEIVYVSTAHQPDITQAVLQRLNQRAEEADQASAADASTSEVSPEKSEQAPIETDAASAPSQPKLAVVNLEKVFSEYRRFTRQIDEFKAEVAVVEREGSAKFSEFALKNMKPAKNKEEALRNFQEMMAKMPVDLSAAMELAAGHLHQTAAQLYDETYDEVLAEVACIAQQRGFRVVYRANLLTPPKATESLLMRKETYQRINQSILYACSDEPPDLTQEVLDRLNKDKEAKKLALEGRAGWKPTLRDYRIRTTP